MSIHVDTLRLRLAGGPLPARVLATALGVSQPTVSRALAGLGDEVVRFGAARSIQYALRDRGRGLPDMAVYRVDAEGRIRRLGMLVPVRPDGFVMQQDDGATLHSDGLPWWLLDMRPQGYLGRAWAARQGAALGLPARLSDWTDTHALRALLAHGHDAVGNLVLGDDARARFLEAPAPVPVPQAEQPATYARLAQEAARGELPGSSAGGEQPKFTTWADTPNGPRPVLVKFSETEAGPVPERWRDLLLAEHLALATLRDTGIAAAASRIIDHGAQRFLEVERFDRVGPLGRRGLLSLAALDAEFTGAAPAGWPTVTQRLAQARIITPEATVGAQLLWAFGTLIGNTDMHTGNLSFLSEHGRPYALAPAYDMTPMAFAPRSSGGFSDTPPAPRLDPGVPHATWRQAQSLAHDYLARLQATDGFSARFAPCVAALAEHLEAAAGKIGRLG
jgi:hypothetical protein